MLGLEAVDQLSNDECKGILKEIFKHATEPAFGILPQRELDLMLFRALRKAGVITTNASLYELMSQLKITRAKARNLIFDLEMREASESSSLDERAKHALSNPRGFVKDGAYLVFGVENPVVQAHIKEKVNQLGHLTDASFDSALIRIKPSALPDLVESLMSAEDQRVFKEAMIEAGYETDDTLSAALAESIKFLGKKYIGDAATEIAGGYIEGLAKLMMPSVLKSKEALKGLFSEMFSSKKAAEPKIR